MNKIFLRITRIVNETPASKTFYLKPEADAIQYKAGQFLTLLLHINGKEVRRSYSLGSTAGIDDQMFITFKRIDNGEASRYLFDKIKEGDVLEALPPSGRFIVDEQAELYFFIAAGSGITPIFSILKDLLRKNDKSKLILLYQNTNEALSIYRNNLLELQQKHKNRFHLIELFSRPLDQRFFPRRLNNYSLEQTLLKQVTTRDVMFYLCGPNDFMRMAEFTLKVMGYEDKQIRKENFVVGKTPPPPFMTETSAKELKIHFNNKEHLLLVAYPHNILEVALQHGIQLPYSCRGGRCSTCAATCLSGKVKMSINEVLTEKDLSKGLVLTCVGYPETDVELKFDL